MVIGGMEYVKKASMIAFRSYWYYNGSLQKVGTFLPSFRLSLSLQVLARFLRLINKLLPQLTSAKMHSALARPFAVLLTVCSLSLVARAVPRSPGGPTHPPNCPYATAQQGNNRVFLRFWVLTSFLPSLEISILQPG